MYIEFFSKSPLLALPLFALFVFIAVFAAVTIRTLGRHGREQTEREAMIPFEDSHE